MKQNSNQLLSVDFSKLCNRQGSLRVDFVRKYFGLIRKFVIEGKTDYDIRIKSSVKQEIPLTSESINEITDLYVSWRDTVELIPLRLTYADTFFMDLSNTPIDIKKWIDSYNTNTGLQAARLGESRIICYEGFKQEWVLKQSCKRGNEVYIKQLKYKFKDFFKSENNKDFFSTVVNSKRKRVRKTKMLYLTGTCDNNITGSISDSWLKFGNYWNKFCSNLRFMFGNISYIRTWQSQKNGYPHFHALVYFNDFDFSVVYWEQDKSFRIHNRQKINQTFVRDKIKAFWEWGNLDIKCCDSTKKAFRDLLKYVTKDLEGGESDLTNAMVWYFGKQSFAVSKSFRSLFLNDSESSLEPSDDDLINSEAVIKSSNSKFKLVRIEIFPLIRRDLLPNFTQLNLKNYVNPPEPPPEIIDYLDFYAFDCKPSSVKKIENYEVVLYKRGDL